MDHFSYRGGVLHAEAVPLPEIAAAVGTPVYVYSSATLARHYRVFEEALAGLDHLICYAVKANSNLAVLALMGSLGAGMDVVSEGEYRRARAAGVPGERIVFSGRGQDPRGDAGGARGRGAAVQRRERARARGAERGGGGAGAGGAGGGQGQPGRGRAHARQDRHGQGREQVRGADRAGARRSMPGRRRCRGSTWWGSTSTSAASSSELAPYEAAFAQGGGADRRAAGGRACHPAARPRRRPGDSLPAGGERGAAAALRLWRGDPAHGRASRLRDRDRAGAADRGQRRGAAGAGHLSQGRARGGTS